MGTVPAGGPERRIEWKEENPHPQLTAAVGSSLIVLRPAGPSGT
jgi:hypothetical protein